MKNASGGDHDKHNQQSACSLRAFRRCARHNAGRGSGEDPGTKPDTVDEEIAGLLKDARDQARDLHEHAMAMQAANPVQLDRSFYTSESTNIREDVNAMGATIARLQVLEPLSSDKALIESAKAQLSTIAATTEHAILYLNENPKRLETPVYRNLTRSLTDETSTLWTMLHDSHRLEDLKTREQRIQSELATINGER